MNSASPVCQHDHTGLIQFPLIVLSDLHLAHPATFLVDPGRLLPVLEGFRTVVFNGDTCELLSLKHRSEGREKLYALSEHCQRQGVRPIFLTGNHDPFVSSQHHVDVLGGRVFITHGDVLHPWLAPWSRDAAWLKRERQRLLSQLPEPTCWDEAISLTKRISLIASRYDTKGEKGFSARAWMVGKFALQPWRAIHALYYWSNVSHYAHRVQERFRPDAQLMIIGHTHRPGVWKLPTFSLVNTGSFQPMSYPLVVQLNEHRARVNLLERGSSGYKLGREIHHWHWDEHGMMRPSQ
jgi:UDP-2,3-diacylglucosamine pyrophosphatase LpxH